MYFEGVYVKYPKKLLTFERECVVVVKLVLLFAVVGFKFVPVMWVYAQLHIGSV